MDLIMKKVFYMNDLRKIINLLDKEEISMSKALEMLNEKVDESHERLIEAEKLLNEAKNCINHSRLWIKNLSVKYDFDFDDNGVYKKVQSEIEEFLNK